MGRRRRAEPREIPPDPRYNSVEVAKFINKVMKNGKKTKAQKIVYLAFDEVERATGRNALEVFHQAIQNTTPVLEVRPRRVGGATYQIPVEVAPSRGISLAMRWIIQSARAKGGRPMYKRLAEELVAAARGEGAAVKRKEDLHRMAEANRAFIHYRW